MAEGNVGKRHGLGVTVKHSFAQPNSRKKIVNSQNHLNRKGRGVKTR